MVELVAMIGVMGYSLCFLVLNGFQLECAHCLVFHVHRVYISILFLAIIIP